MKRKKKRKERRKEGKKVPNKEWNRKRMGEGSDHEQKKVTRII